MTDSKVETSNDEHNDMEEGELSDDSTSPPPDPVINRGHDIPDLLKEIGGTADIFTMNEEAMEKMSSRGKRFQTGSVISISALGSLYKSLGVPIADCPERRQWKLEEVWVWGEERLNHSDLTSIFFEYHPLSVEVMRNGREAVVSWATPTQAAKAIQALSREIGEPGNSKLVKHVISPMEETKVITEETLNLDMVHPEDIDIDLPEGGPWRLMKGEVEGVVLVRFVRANIGNVRPSLGLLSGTKRKELLLEQEKAVEREQEIRSKVVDKRNPWGSVAARWADEQRGGGSSSNVRDWDTPVNQIVETNRGSIKDRLNFNARVNIDIDDNFLEEEEEDVREDDNDEIDWSSRMKRPRMGMVADMVEKKSSAVSRLGGRNEEVIKRKVPKRGEVKEKERRFGGGRLADRLGERKEDIKRSLSNRDEQDANEKVKERRFAVGGRRLGDRFAGGRLEGRLGGGNFTIERKDGGRLIELERNDSEEARRKTHYDSGDSLERDDGADIMDERSTNMVIQVTQSSDSEDGMVRNRHRITKEERRRQEREDKERRHERERKERRLEKEGKERQTQRELLLEKEMQEEKKRRMERSKVIKEREDALQERKGMKETNQLIKKEEGDEKYKNEDLRKLVKGRKRYSSEEESESESEGSESGSESDSSSESPSEESSDSDSDSDKSDSEDDKKKKKKHSHLKKREEYKYQGTVDGKAKSKLLPSKGNKSKSNHISHQKDGTSKESSEDQKKAAELKDKLKNYLKKAKEAKENKKKSLKPN